MKKIEQLEYNLAVGVAMITEEYGLVRNDVQFTIKNAHLELERFHKGLMKTIEDYEKE